MARLPGGRGNKLQPDDTQVLTAENYEQRRANLPLNSQQFATTVLPTTVVVARTLPIVTSFYPVFLGGFLEAEGVLFYIETPQAGSRINLALYKLEVSGSKFWLVQVPDSALDVPGTTSATYYYKFKKSQQLVPSEQYFVGVVSSVVGVEVLGADFTVSGNQGPLTTSLEYAGPNATSLPGVAYELTKLIYSGDTPTFYLLNSKAALWGVE